MLKFKQSDWMKIISISTLKKEHMLLTLLKKIFLNWWFIVPIANLWTRINVRLVNNEKIFLKYTNRPIHVIHKIFGKNNATVHEIKPVLTLNKPIYVWFTVLELITWLTYDFHYSFIEKHFDTELLFTDTDSVYEEFFQHKYLFDFSNYPKVFWSG